MEQGTQQSESEKGSEEVLANKQLKSFESLTHFTNQRGNHKNAKVIPSSSV